jgi:hypothetical protein
MVGEGNQTVGYRELWALEAILSEPQAGIRQAVA